MKFIYGYDRQYDIVCIHIKNVPPRGVCTEVHDNVNWFFDYETDEFIGVDIFDFVRSFKRNIKVITPIGTLRTLLIRLLIALHVDRIK